MKIIPDAVLLFSSRNYTGPQKSAGEGKGSSRVTYSKASKAYNPAIEVDDDSHSKYMSDSKRYQAYERDIEDSEVRPCHLLCCKKREKKKK